MTERPILFSAPMVRAIISGTKTQTRRVVKPQPADDERIVVLSKTKMSDGNYRPTMWLPKPVGDDTPRHGAKVLTCPYGAPGDRLWVREAWTTHACFDHIRAGELTTRSLHYQADGRIQTGRNRAAMHMPRWASRITLEVTGVRVERLQEISEADCQAEGIESYALNGAESVTGGLNLPAGYYRYLWESINGPGSWDANPWVWVVEFKRLEG